MASMALSATSLVFKVWRCEPELVAPAKPTPHEFKQLSDIDDREREQVPIVMLYRNDESMEGKDPVKVIREALAQTLVFYYPFAGRLRQGPDAKFMVECTGEGVMFIEADADVTLEEFGVAPHPPFPCENELLYEVPGSRGLLNCPLLLIQVTRLRCRGFIFAVRLNHVMSDGAGLVQFINAITEMARGACAPSTSPVWQRELLNARNPPQVTFTHHEFDELVETQDFINHMARYTFFFGSNQVTAIRKSIPHHLRKSSTFELVTACLWRCRTIALQLNPNDVVRLLFAINMRKMFSPPFPVGYYGNAIAPALALTTVEKLCENPLKYALELIKNAKANVTEEYFRSLIDLVVIKDRPFLNMVRSYYVSDVRHLGFADLNFGWGKASFGGQFQFFQEPNSYPTSYYIPVKNSQGDDGFMVPMCLPTLAMERFVKELYSILGDHLECNRISKFIISSL